MDLNPVTLPAVTNRESYSQILGLYDDDTGDPLNLAGYTFTAEVRRKRIPRTDESGYTPNYDYGGVNDWGPMITLALGSGLTIIDLGQLQFNITLQQMRTLTGPEVYSFAISISNDGFVNNAQQIFVADLPVLYGALTSRPSQISGSVFRSRAPQPRFARAWCPPHTATGPRTSAH